MAKFQCLVVGISTPVVFQRPLTVIFHSPVQGGCETVYAVSVITDSSIDPRGALLVSRLVPLASGEPASINEDNVEAMLLSSRRQSVLYLY